MSAAGWTATTLARFASQMAPSSLCSALFFYPGPIDTGPIDTGPIDTGPIGTGSLDG